ncbi:MAG: redoxin family protein [Pirellulales bacterium]
MRYALRFLSIIGLVSVAVAVGAANRTWTDKTGKHKTEAELVEATADSVVLKLSDGKTKTVLLDRLSEADQKFVAEHLAAKSADEKDTSTKPAAKGGDAAAVRKVAGKFFDDLVSDDQTALGETLTAAAKQQLTAGGSPVQSLPKPDSARLVKLGKATIEGEEAILAFKIRIGGTNQEAKLHLRRESGEWKIRAVSATPPEGVEQTIDFEGAANAAATAEGETPGVPAPGEPLPTEDYPKKSPFAGVRWQDSQPEVKVGEEWFKLVSLNELPASEIVAFSRRTFGSEWRKRFEEDLVELLTLMGHPPQDEVTLVVQSLTSSETWVREGVAMTEANRQAIRVSAPAEPMPDAGLTVPEGDAQEVLKFIADLQKDPRLAQDQTFRKQAITLMLAAADKVFGLEGATKTQLTTAAGHKLQALQALIGSDVTDLNEQIEAFAQQIKQHELADVERPLEALTLRMELQTADKPAAATAALKKIDRFLAEGAIGPAEIILASVAAQLAEQMQYRGMKHADIAEAINRLAEPLAASSIKEVAAIGNQLLGKARRLGLVGNPMELRGLTWNGQPLDMSQFEGKVVLVDFWATWCGPCIAEMPNIKKNYDQYHEQGFDVIAISIDRDLKALRAYVEKEQVPWTVVADNHEENPRSDNMSDLYGVNSIPCTILIGRDGKVVALNIRGTDLDKQLEKLIGSGG